MSGRSETGPRASASRAAGKRERNKHENREMILSAARQVFSDLGFDATTVRDIVRRTGLASGTFYNYFRSKEEVFEAVLDATALSIRPRLREIRVNARTFEEFIEGTFRAFFEHVAADRQMFDIVQRNAGCLRVRLESPEVVAGLEELRADIDRAIGEGVAPATDAEYLTAAIIGLAFEIADRMMRREPIEVEPAVAFAKALILGGVSALHRADASQASSGLRAAG